MAAMQGPPGYGPVMVLNPKTERKTGRQAQLSNITAARAVSDIIRTTLGPRSMLKMLLDPMGGVVITNDGNCILREVDVSHPTAKSMIELSRAQDEEVGDGTTSVIILAGEMLILSEQLLRINLHPTVIVSGYNLALQEAMAICERQALTVDVTDDKRMKQLVQSCIGTKFSSRWNDKMVEMALQAVLTVARAKSSTPAQSAALGAAPNSASNPYNHKVEVDIKRYAKVEKIPGGEITDSCVLKGVMFNKDTSHSKMRRRITNPRILLLDCPLEYKKGESQTNVEITNTEDWNTMLRMEEEYVENMCMEIIAFQPDVVITEKGVSDLAQHYLAKANITAFRRLRKTDNNRVARATGATIVSRTDEIQEGDIGQRCGLFEMRKISDEWFCFLECGYTIYSYSLSCFVALLQRCGLFEMRKISDEISIHCICGYTIYSYSLSCFVALLTYRAVRLYIPSIILGFVHSGSASLEECEDPKACTIILRGGSKDVLNEIERNLHDAMEVVRNVVYDPKLLPGGGATEMAVAAGLRRAGLKVEGVRQHPFCVVGDAMEVIPRTLAQNCGVSVIRTVTQLRAKHASFHNDAENVVGEGASAVMKPCNWGINGTTGDLVDMEELGIWEPFSVKVQTIKTAIESACMILRIDDIVSGSKKGK
eukprot:CAMPEP_0198276112 /NCGR_PEP_ID=MMETSP1447-20131203/65129_1 /TAXON_ID=420782 /ORGANISM="Chaetoceros dichaeta, Strain CCMP1751" /LENGTH=652 /DNA_ID=CAMNT_0043971031 /DNA_START=23 /DNA_END=1980 /DNA_ORIENTATION=+